MKNKKQKTISKIICTALAFFVFMLNSGAAQVAYAATPPKPDAKAAPAKTADAACESGWTLNPEDKSTCYKDIKAGEQVSCQSGFQKINWQSTETKIICGPIAKFSSDNIGNVAKNIQIIAGLQHMLNRLIWPVLILIGGLMENDLLFGNGMEEKLREIWIPMRNLVNILFVIVLVGLALYNVLGLAEDNTSIKSMLPKIIVGIIAVNFSFVAIKVMLDGINVLTTSIFALPGNINEELAEVVRSNDSNNKLIQRFCVGTEGLNVSQVDDLSDQKIKQEQEFKAYHSIVEASYKDAGIGASDPIATVKEKIKTKYGATGLQEFEGKVAATQDSSLCSGKKLTAQGKIFLSKYNSRNAAFALALNMGKIVFYEDVKVDNTPGKEAEAIFTNALFSTVLYLVYAASFIALFAVLLGRLVVMWLSIAVSPILLLMIASPTLKEKMGGLSKLSEQFTKNAIAPILIALSLTVGWIMLRAVQGLDFGKNVGTYFNKSLAINIGSGVPVASLNTLQDFVVALGVIAVVWMGVFSAAEGTVAQFATDFIKDKLQTAGKWVGSLPFKHMPMIPIQLPGHPRQTYTLSSLDNALTRMMDTSEKDQALWKAMSGESSIKAEDITKVKTQPELLSHLKQITKQGELDSKVSRDGIRSWLRSADNESLLKKLGLSSADGKKVEDAVRALASDKPSDDKVVQDAVAVMKNNHLVQNAAAPSTTTPPAAPGSTPPKPGDAPKPAAAPAITPATPFNGKTLGDAIKGTDGKPDTSKITSIKTERDKLSATIKDGNDGAITTQLGALGTALAGTGLKEADLADNLESLLGKPQFEALKKALPEKDGKTTVTRIIEALKPPAPPAPPATPTPPAPTP